MNNLKKQDPELYDLLLKEHQRQQNGLVMIPSENLASPAVLEALSSVAQNKYAEGYPGKRYYTGAEYIDQIEQLAIDRAKQLFEAEHVNVQPHSGSSANMEIFASLLKPGDKVLGLDLSHGGHLTHGSPVNFSGKTYHFISYGVNKDSEKIDMDEVREIALREKPKLIISGATAYPREIDFEAFDQICQEIQAYHLSDISHIVGLCLAGAHPSPIKYADVVMTTTTKTLRGPRSAIILSKIKDRWQEIYFPEEKKNLAQRIDFNVFPGMQGGPLEHVIAAKAVCFKEAMTDEFKQIQLQTKKNAKVLAEVLRENGVRLVSGGTDNHLILADMTSLGLMGLEASEWLAKAYIYTNRNAIPFDPGTPFKPAGLRIGTPALSTRGMKEKEMQEIGKLIIRLLKNINNQDVLEESRRTVLELTSAFPIYQEIKI